MGSCAAIFVDYIFLYCGFCVVYANERNVFKFYSRLLFNGAMNHDPRERFSFMSGLRIIWCLMQLINNYDYFYCVFERRAFQIGGCWIRQAFVDDCSVIICAFILAWKTIYFRSRRFYCVADFIMLYTSTCSHILTAKRLGSISHSQALCVNWIIIYNDLSSN